MNSPKLKLRGIVVLSSGVFYLAALPAAALNFAVEQPVSGFSTLLWGWWGVLKGDFPWFANLFYVTAIAGMLLGLYKCGLLFSGVALLLGSSTVRVKEWYFNEGGGTPIVGLGPAYDLWMTSFAVLLAGGIGLEWLRVRSRRQASARANLIPPPLPT